MAEPRQLENWLKSYMQFTVHSEAPDPFHFWTGVGTIAGALRRQVWIDCQYWEWVPNFYIIFVAPPGIVSKSTTAGIGMNLLKQIEGVKFGPDSTTWQMLIQEMAEATDGFLHQGRIYRHSSITVVASELGTFLKPQDGEMIDSLVSLWDGQKGTYRKATKTQGEDKIINPWINLIGCTTPAWITQAFPEYMIGGGFTSRTIFVYADQKRRLVAYPARHVTDEDPQLERDLVHDLRQIATMRGEMHLTPDAFELGEEWYNEFHTNPPAHLRNERFGGYIARKQTHIHKLAMVLSAAESNFLTIEKHHLEQAIAVVGTLEADMPKVFSRIGQDDQTRRASKVRDLIYTHKKIKLDWLWVQCMDFMSMQEFKAALAGMIMAKQAKQKQVGGVNWIELTIEETNAPKTDPNPEAAGQTGSGSGTPQDLLNQTVEGK